MEAAAIIGLVASITSLVELSAKVISRIHESVSQISEIPESFLSLTIRLPLLMATLQRIRTQAEAGRLPDDVSNILRAVVDSTSEQVAAIQIRLSKILLPDGASKLERALKVFKSLAKEDEVQQALEKIYKNSDILVLYQTTRHVDTGERILDELSKLTVASIASSTDEQFANVNKALLSHEKTLNLVQQSTGMIRMSLNTLTNIAYLIYSLCKQSVDSSFAVEQLLRAQNNQIEQLYKIQGNLPAQILFSQPVILIDAFDQPLPFHLETVNSKGILMAILKERYKDAGLQKLRSGEYVIEDTITNQDIDLDRPWHLCFRAGDRKAMSFEFPDVASSEKVCPFCQHRYVGEDMQLIKCTSCTRSFKRIEEIEACVQPSSTADAGIGSTPTTLGTTTHGTPRIPADESRTDRILDFARVRLKRKNQIFSLHFLHDFISAIPVTAGIRSTQWLGQMSAVTLRQLTQAREESNGLVDTSSPLGDLAEDHPDRLASQHELARAYRANRQVKEAVSLLEQVVKDSGADTGRGSSGSTGIAASAGRSI